MSINRNKRFISGLICLCLVCCLVSSAICVKAIEINQNHVVDAASNTRANCPSCGYFNAITYTSWSPWSSVPILHGDHYDTLYIRILYQVVLCPVCRYYSSVPIDNQQYIVCHNG